jgi:hypothetical protein
MASGVVSLARPALAQTPTLLSGDQPVLSEQNLTLTDGHSHLEEMKVQLALLADIATFPYYLGASAIRETLTVRGYVPNERVKQRALELARQHTFLQVVDGLRVQGNLSLRPPLRAAEVLQKEGTELLAKNLGEVGRLMQVQVRPNGLVVVSGPVESVEEKLAVSRLFRQLGGCSGVVNDLAVQPILRDGQRLIAVTRDGTQMVAPSALGMEPDMAIAPPVTPGPIPGTWTPAPLPHKDLTPPAPLPSKEPTALPAAPSLPAPKPSTPTTTPIMPIPTVPTPPTSTPTASPSAPSHTLDVHEGELQLPSGKPSSASPSAAPKATDSGTPEIKKLSSVAPEAAPAPLPTVKSKRSAMSWDSDNTPPAATPRIITVPSAEQKPASASHDETPKVKKGTPHKPDSFASDSAAPTHSDGSADALIPPAPPMTWRRPGASESSEPPAKVTPKTTPTPAAPKAPSAPAPSVQGVTGASFERVPAPAAAAVPPSTPATAPAAPPTSAPAAPPAAAPPARTMRRWPPAYDVRPAQVEAGHAGTIEFEEEPPAEPAQAPAPTPASTPAPATPRTTTQDLYTLVVPENLKKQVKAVCGRQAKDVTVEVQPDGTVRVSVKATKAAEKQLTSKILAIPEMSSPKVRLSIDVVP